MKGVTNSVYENSRDLDQRPGVELTGLKIDGIVGKM
jgi:hypothetical protein